MDNSNYKYYKPFISEERLERIKAMIDDYFRDTIREPETLSVPTALAGEWNTEP